MNSWRAYGERMERHWRDIGEIVGNLRELMEKALQNHGEIMVKLRE